MLYQVQFTPVLGAGKMVKVQSCMRVAAWEPGSGQEPCRACFGAGSLTPLSITCSPVGAHGSGALQESCLALLMH